MIRLKPLLLCLLLVLPFTARAQEDSLIETTRTEITALRDAASATPALAAVRGRLSRAFIDNDIVFSRRYLDSWSLQLQDRWSQHDAFFATQLDLLSAWDQALASGSVSPETAEAALEPAMVQMRQIADQMPDWLDDDAARMADRAFWTDLAQEIGCCDPLYYQALSEANGVWGVALSPDPAAIAALQIVPSVPSDDGPTETTADRAYAWLASRAEGLMSDNAASPARRRALLVEACLLEALFGLPDDMELERSLETLVAREGFAAQPVAPLIRMAALTEPGPMRQMLLDHATARLDSRAAYLRPALQAATATAEAVEAAVEVEDQDGTLTRSLAGPAPTRQMGGAGTANLSPAPAAPAAPAVPLLVQSTDAEAALLVDEALAALLTAGNGDPALFIDIAGMAERADALIGSGTSLDLVESLSADPLR